VELGYAVAGACASPLAGAEGNREFFLHLRRAAVGRRRDDLVALVASAVAAAP
jgi:hypothetical protein